MAKSPARSWTDMYVVESVDAIDERIAAAEDAAGFVVLCGSTPDALTREGGTDMRCRPPAQADVWETRGDAEWAAAEWAASIGPTEPPPRVFPVAEGLRIARAELLAL